MSRNEQSFFLINGPGLPGWSSARRADPVFNTGVNGSGAPLTDGTVGDPHYTLIAVPDGSTTDIRVRTSAGGPPVTNAWLGDDSISAWIGPNNGPDVHGPE